jgi:ankyrin repeat protein/tetratricopeptide (TPR) repeat protein
MKSDRSSARHGEARFGPGDLKFASDTQVTGWSMFARPDLWVRSDKGLGVEVKKGRAVGNVSLSRQIGTYLKVPAPDINRNDVDLDGMPSPLGLLCAPAIRVYFNIQSVAGEGIPALCPGANRLQLVRADLPEGPYSLVETVKKKRFLDLIGKHHPVLKPKSEVTELRQATYRGFIVDTDVKPFVRYYYKIRFTKGRGNVLVESGYCSAMAQPTPARDIEVDQAGYATCSWEWEGWDETSMPAGRVQVVAATKPGQHLVRVPYRSGTFTTPIPVPPAQDPDLGAMVWWIEMPQTMDSWSKKEGQFQESGFIYNPEEMTFSVPERLSRPPKRNRKNPPTELTVWKPHGDGKEFGYLSMETQLVYPGLPGIEEFELKHPGTGQAMHAATPRTPLVGGLRAVTGNEQVSLTWSPVLWEADHWSRVPEILVLRSELNPLEEQQRIQDQPPMRILARLSADQTVYVDHDVVNDGLYRYAIEVQGVLRTTNWHPVAGTYTAHVPVQSRCLPGSTGRYVIAHPEAPRPLRAAIISDVQDDTVLNAAKAELYRVLDAPDWLDVVERSAAGSLFEEKRLEGLAGKAEAETTLPLVDVRAADMILRLKSRHTHDGAFLDLWFDEIANSRRERFWTLPYGDIDVEAVADEALRKIAELYPGADRKLEQREQTACGSIRRIAVAGLQPVSGGAPDPHGIEDLLAAALSGHGCLELVERAEIARVIHELEGSDLAAEEMALQLGALINAHAILTGFYGFQDGVLTLDGRLIETRTGAIIQHIQGSAELAKLAELENSIVEGILTAASPKIQGSDNRMLRILEAKVHEQELSGEDGLKAASLVSPDSPDFHYKLGIRREEEGRPEEALAHYYDGIKRAEQKGGPWKLYLAADRIHLLAGQRQELLSLWTRAVKHFEKNRVQGRPGSGDAASPQEEAARLSLAECLYETGGAHVAELHLDAITRGSWRRGRLYEKLDRREKAIDAYAGALVFDRLPVRAGTQKQYSYAALLRMLRGSDRQSERERILRAIGSTAQRNLLYQKVRALDQLMSEVGADESLRLDSARAAGQARYFDSAFDRLTDLVGATKDASIRLNAMNEMAILYYRLGKVEEEKRMLQAIVDTNQVPEESRVIFETAARKLERLVEGKVPPPKDLVLKRGQHTRLVVQAEDADYVWHYPPHISRRDKASGEIIWETDLRGEYSDWSRGGERNKLTATGLITDGEYLFVPIADQGVIHGLNAQTGERAWLYIDWTSISAPFLLDGRLYVGNTLGDLTVLSPKTGEILREVVHEARREDRRLGSGSFTLQYDPDKREIHFASAKNLFIHETEIHLLADGDQRILGTRLNHSVQIDSYDVTSTPPKKKRTDPVELVEAEIEKILDPARRRPAKYEDGDTRTHAIRRVKTLPRSEYAIPVLLDVCRDQMSYLGSERIEAAQALSSICGAAILPEVLFLVNDHVPDVRKEAAEMIGRFGSESHWELLVDLVHDVDVDVQLAALQSLVAMIGVDAGPHLQTIFDDKYSSIRREVALYLLVAGDESMKPLVYEMYRDYKLKTHRKAVYQEFVLLCKEGVPGALRILQQKVRDRDLHILRRVLNAITRFAPDPAFLPILLDEVGPEESSEGHEKVSVLGMAEFVRGSAAATIAAMNQPAAIPHLLEKMGTSRIFDGGGKADPVMTALEELTGKSLGRQAFRWKYWWEKDGRNTYEPEELELKVSEEMRRALKSEEKSPPGESITLGPCRPCEEALNGNLAMLTRLLDGGADINQRDEFGRSPLINAVRGEHPEVAMELLRRGADVNLPSLENETPIMYTTEHGDLALTRELVRRGAIITMSARNGGSALYQASRLGHRDIVEFLLDCGAGVDIQPLRGNKTPGTPLIVAVEKGQMEVARFLISRGADLEARTWNGLTPLLVLSYDNRPEFTSMLIDAGANVDAANAYGWTAILIGAHCGHIEPIKLLVDAGANVNAVTSEGATALLVAVGSGNLELAEFLIEEGADVDLAILSRQNTKYGGEPHHLQWLEKKRSEAE